MSQRTDQQNKALHLYCELLAKELNDAGLSVQETLKNYRMEIAWNKDSVKELIWRPVQVALLHKRSTTELDKQMEIDEVYEHINRFVSQMGIHVPFPVDEERQKEKSYL